MFQVVLGNEDIAYYVPFVASVLLVSLGSDCSIFLVGRIWQERRARPLRSAIETAVPSAGRAISVAALTLALRFSPLAIVRLGAFRQLAFLLAVGVLIDSFVARSLLVPALVALFGRTHVEEEGEAPDATAPDNAPKLPGADEEQETGEKRPRLSPRVARPPASARMSRPLPAAARRV